MGFSTRVTFIKPLNYILKYSNAKRIKLLCNLCFSTRIAQFKKFLSLYMENNMHLYNIFLKIHIIRNISFIILVSYSWLYLFHRQTNDIMKYDSLSLSLSLFGAPEMKPSVSHMQGNSSTTQLYHWLCYMIL